MWTMTGDGAAVGTDVPVVVDGVLLAVLTPLWDDRRGVGVHVVYDGPLDDLSAAQARGLADALAEVADATGPE